jgi:hypothetical protein
VEGKIPFLRAEESFLLTSGDIDTSGFRSWIFHSCKQCLNFKNGWLLNEIDQLNQDGNFVSKFPILPKVARILAGESVDIVREDLDLDLHARMMGGSFISIEAALWFTLFTVEARIGALWDTVQLKEIEDEKSESEEDDSTNSSISPTLAGLLGVWIMICRKVDPFSPQNVVQEMFEQVLEEWKEMDRLCIPKPHEDKEWEAVDSPSGQPLTGKEFHTWAAFGKRIYLIRQMLPWLQLRSIVMYHYLLCCEDSSDVSLAELSDLRVRVA